MTTILKTTRLTVPSSIRRRAGFKAGDRVEFKVAGGIISIIPKLPSADHEYTPAQRAVIDARLATADEGPHHGPFPSAGHAVKFVKAEIARRRKTRKSSQQ